MLGQPQSFFVSANAAWRIVAICRQSHSRWPVACAMTTMEAIKRVISLSAASIGFSPGFCVVGNVLDYARVRV